MTSRFNNTADKSVCDSTRIGCVPGETKSHRKRLRRLSAVVEHTAAAVILPQQCSASLPRRFLEHFAIPSASKDIGNLPCRLLKHQVDAGYHIFVSRLVRRIDGIPVAESVCDETRLCLARLFVRKISNKVRIRLFKRLAIAAKRPEIPCYHHYCRVENRSVAPLVAPAGRRRNAADLARRAHRVEDIVHPLAI